MRPRSLFIGVAAVVVLVVAVIGLRRGGDRRDAPSPAVRTEPEAASPSSVDRGSVATPSRTSASTEAPTASPSASATGAPTGRATPPSLPPAYDEVPIPTELPDSPSFVKELSRDGAIRDYREVYTYQLGLMAHYQKCMNGRIKRGLIYYYIKWGVDDDHIATAPFYDRTAVPSEGDVTPEDEAAFEACVKEYLATHDRVALPHGSPNGEAWGMRAVFPLSESALLKMIAQAKAEPAGANR